MTLLILTFVFSNVTLYAKPNASNAKEKFIIRVAPNSDVLPFNATDRVNITIPEGARANVEKKHTILDEKTEKGKKTYKIKTDITAEVFLDDIIENDNKLSFLTSQIVEAASGQREDSGQTVSSITATTTIYYDIDFKNNETYYKLTAQRGKFDRTNYFYTISSPYVGYDWYGADIKGIPRNYRNTTSFMTNPYWTYNSNYYSTGWVWVPSSHFNNFPDFHNGAEANSTGLNADVYNNNGQYIGQVLVSLRM